MKKFHKSSKLAKNFFFCKKKTIFLFIVKIFVKKNWPKNKKIVFCFSEKRNLRVNEFAITNI